MHPKPLKTFTNKEDGMESYVFESTRGGYNVTLKDLDSGLMVPHGFNFPDLHKAEQKAKEIAGLKTAAFSYDRRR